MGLLDIFKRSAKSAAPSKPMAAGQRWKAASKIQTPMTSATGITVDLVKLSGTTTFCNVEIQALAARHGLIDRGILETPATLQREPNNQADPHAVAVFVEGSRIGYLPGYVAKSIGLNTGVAREVPFQLFTVAKPSGIRGEAWVWMAGGAPQWQFTASTPPPLTTEEKRQQEAKERTSMVDEALAGGGLRAAQFEAGLVDGVHYLEYVEPIKQLKREGRHTEALDLAYKAMEGAEASREGREPPPWYFEQAAIIHRKLGEQEKEVAVLKRWLRFMPESSWPDTNLGRRLEKLQS